MNTIFKSEQIYLVSNMTGLSLSDVGRILDSYNKRVSSRVSKGETVKYLNICYLVCNKEKDNFMDTLAYTCYEIARELGYSRDVVLRVLLSYNDMIVDSVKRFYPVTVKGVVAIKLIEYDRGIYKVRLSKSGRFKHDDVRICTLSSFRRKVEGYDGKNS